MGSSFSHPSARRQRHPNPPTAANRNRLITWLYSSSPTCVFHAGFDYDKDTIKEGVDNAADHSRGCCCVGFDAGAKRCPGTGILPRDAGQSAHAAQPGIGAERAEADGGAEDESGRAAAKDARKEAGDICG